MLLAVGSETSTRGHYLLDLVDHGVVRDLLFRVEELNLLLLADLGPALLVILGLVDELLLLLLLLTSLLTNRLGLLVHDSVISAEFLSEKKLIFAQ